MIRTLIAERNALVRVGLGALLKREPDMEVVAELDGPGPVVSAARALAASVALLDGGITAHDRFATVRALRAAVPGCGTVIMASTGGSSRELQEAIDARADGFVLKDSDPARITEAVRRVAAGMKAIDPEVAYSALDSRGNPLTPREADVLRLVAEGSRATEIASELYLSVGTVRNYLSRVMRKIGARNRVDAIRIADRAGWLEPRSAPEDSGLISTR